MSPSSEPESGPGWDERASLPGMAPVLDPLDPTGAKNRLIDRVQREALDSVLGNLKGLRALDLGCGTGRLSGWLRDKGALVTGVDPSEPMLRRARAEVAGVDFLSMTAPRIPCPEAHFDLVLSVGVLQYVVRDVEAVDALLREVVRVLAPGGRVVAIEQVADEPLGRGASSSEYAAILRRSGLAMTRTEHVRLGDSDTIARCLRHRWMARVPGTVGRILAEARAASGLFTGGRYVDELFVATKPV